MAMIEAKISDDKIVAEGEEAKELYDSVWYGSFENGRLTLDPIEVCSLLERQKIELKDEKGEKINYREFFKICSENDKRFICRYFAYKDLRERGLPVRMGFKGSDFRVYDRGVKPSNPSEAKWIVFAESEDYPCEFDKLPKAIKLAENIRSIALWAIVDNDSDVTYYIIGHAVNV